MDCCYSNLLDLLRVKTRICSYNLYAKKHLFSFPSQLTLVKLIKLKRTQSVCTEKERKEERKTDQTVGKEHGWSCKVQDSQEFKQKVFGSHGLKA